LQPAPFKTQLAIDHGIDEAIVVNLMHNYVYYNLGNIYTLSGQIYIDKSFEKDLVIYTGNEIDIILENLEMKGLLDSKFISDGKWYAMTEKALCYYRGNNESFV